MADSTKECTKCGETKPVTEFQLKRQAGRNPYRNSKCVPCERQYYKDRTATKRNDRDWKHRRQMTQIKTKYGLTKDQYIDMMLEQDFCCAFCAQPQAAFLVDHDHACCDREKSCGECVRFLLCQACNTMIGMAKDNPATLRRAADLLEASSGSTD